MAKRQKNRQHSGKKTEEQTTQWQKDRRTDNTVAKRQKNRQHNGKKTEEQTTQWQKDRRTDNTVAKRQKNRQHSGKKTEEQTTQWQKEEEQTTQWQKENLQKDKQRSTTHTYKTKDRVTRSPLSIGDEVRCSGRVSSFCSTSGTVVLI